jgi:hypothetical protein
MAGWPGHNAFAKNSRRNFELAAVLACMCPTNQSPPLKPFGNSGDRESGDRKDRIAGGGEMIRAAVALSAVINLSISVRKTAK